MSRGRAITTVDREVLAFAGAGCTNRQMARIRGRSEDTIRNELTTVFRKLRVQSRAHAVSRALTRGVVTFEQIDDATLAALRAGVMPWRIEG
ncbi:MAG: helix-turn-helix transcriptional regulator [Patescibacteria group bacterium]|nr:helix-turn-helix transcriptional regulator [Patescibacteria group bacterium]